MSHRIPVVGDLPSIPGTTTSRRRDMAMARLTSGCMLWLLVSVAGCQNHYGLVSCEESCPQPGACGPPNQAMNPPPPTVEVKGPGVIHVRAPTPQVEVVLPPNSGAGGGVNCTGG